MAQHMHFCILDGVGSGWCHVWDSNTDKRSCDVQQMRQVVESEGAAYQ